MKPEDVKLSEVYFEFRIVGNFVRVSAIDARSNTEVNMIGDAHVGEETLKRMALRKLRYVIAKKTPPTGGDGPVVA